MNELALFAGAGGGILGGMLHGWRTVAAVEIEDYPRRVLLQRQADGILPEFPIWDDVSTFDGKPWRGKIDIITGGFPCQDISCAGSGEGITGSRSGLWGEMARIIFEVGPSFVFVENSPMLTSRGLGTVLGDLAQMGFNAQWGVLGARDAGAPHKRNRIWIMAHANKERLEGVKRPRRPDSQGWKDKNGPITERCRIPYWNEDPADLPDPHGFNRRPGARREDRPKAGHGGQRTTEPAMGRVAHGVAHRVDRLKALGNGQVPAVAALAWQMLTAGVPNWAPETGAASNVHKTGEQ
tara:strand:+ start:80 stop:964 length:885 start_codon:yes stop_codon:yes gene_type:complete